MSYTIGQVAKEVGLSVPTLRYYEKEGILPPVKRNENGLRIYDTEDIEWLEFACCLRETGMNIAEMKEFAKLALQGDETMQERVQILQAQKDRVKTQVNNLMSYIPMIDHKMETYTSILNKSNTISKKNRMSG
ncbi:MULTISPECIES: MerR family transcriptional regulator [Bacillus]|uniref:MerR family transcriptional regulator n=2 Tax=Bacillus TaxID=1386 RepID=A0A0M4G600_9BACI|nr:MULTISPECIES: MerR family transcriptional regulator [Bacillus]ALC80203.1 MerR family transcriptional regulator [Bacillus gobiensis]MBP1082813.1 DNA-binding transcriptional MerR regulator [Bacillus capparidis]MED1098456.1 MerR family transcriptional regulator [Bacillus capparidis]